jgi:hypothetical protein
MADLLFVFVVVAFFGLMVLLVSACDRIIGPDEPVDATERTAAPSSTEKEVAR